jgi:tripeptide aminopeptidase
MINEERIRNLLVSLVETDSHSRKELPVAEIVRRHCEELGAEVVMDEAAKKVGGNCGNLIARLPATNGTERPFMLSAHMDTVTPGEGVRAVVEDGGARVRSDGTTILGGDDKTGVAVIIETMRAIQENKVPHAGIEAVFSVCEEVGLLGAKQIDPQALRAKEGLVFDADSPTELYTRGPSAVRLEFKIHGLESHAGVAPEAGISAIRVAAEGIARMQLGRIDEETTANIGVIEGGKATNIITNLVQLKGEARSMNKEKLERQVRHMIECLEAAAARHSVERDGETITARVEADVEHAYGAMNVADDAPIVRLVKDAAQSLGMEVRTLASGGGCDANIFNNIGIECANIGTGQRAIHTLNEWVDVKDMCRSARLAIEVVKLHGERATGMK